MIEVIVITVAVAVAFAVIVWCSWGLHTTPYRHRPMPRRYSPPNPMPELKPRPKVTAAPDKKLRRRVHVYYKDGHCRAGVVYREGNVMMDDGEQVSRLDQLLDPSVQEVDIFTEQPKPTVIISQKEPSK